MNNLYLFAIGGSGERVMRSFIMLLAAGVKIGANRVIPIFVDNDEKSMALTRCQDLIKYYNANANNGGRMGIGTVCQQYGQQRSSFFQTPIEKPILLNIAGATIGNLKSIIGSRLTVEDPLQKDILEERDLLFSEDDLSMKLTVGFVGNPNIGSVVLNTLSFADPAFANVLQRASADDGVMVVGSLFGGTGAAGFPLIVNSFNRADNNCPTIGGVAVLPYFDFGAEDLHAENEKIIDTDKWDVNSDSFSTRTRAALMYYDDYMKDMDFLYYVGDDNRAQYPHYVGGAKQDNPVHLVELLGAMSIVDFSKQRSQDTIVYKQPIWGISNDNGGNPSNCNLSSVKNDEVKRALVKFQLMREYFINTGEGFLSHAIANNSAVTQDIKFDESMRQACVGNDPRRIYKSINGNDVDNETASFPYAWGLNAFFKEWVSWFGDLNGNNARRPFTIFPNAATDIDQKNISSKFYSENDNGIAATKIDTKWTFKGTKKIEMPVYPDIATNILNAHKKLKWSNVPEEKKLAALLKTISDGLDQVIEHNCTF